MLVSLLATRVYFAIISHKLGLKNFPKRKVNTYPLPIVALFLEISRLKMKTIRKIVRWILYIHLDFLLIYFLFN